MTSKPVQSVSDVDLPQRWDDVLAALEQGESVAIMRDDTVIAMVHPIPRPVTLREIFERTQ